MSEHDCTLAQRDRGGALALAPTRASDRRQARQCAQCLHTCHRRSGRISKSPRTLTTVCAKTAHAHFSFGRLIAKSSPRHQRVHNGRVHVGRRLAHRIQKRHCSCSMTSSDECVWLWGCLRCRESSMSHQAPHQVTPRATLSPATIEELLADPSRTRGLVLESVPELLSQLALRVAALKTLEGALLSLMLSERIATRGPATPPVNFWPRRTRQALRRSRIVGQRTGAPRQPPIVQTRSLRSLQNRRSRALSHTTRQPSRLTFAPVVYTLLVPVGVPTGVLV